VSEPARDGDDVGSGRDDRRGVTVAERVQGDLRDSARGGEAFPVLSDPVRIAQAALDCTEHERILGEATGPERHPKLELRFPVLPQDSDGAQWQGDQAPPVARLRGLETQPVLLGLFDRALNPKLAAVQVDVTPL
jgi:hypothetical protein